MEQMYPGVPLNTHDIFQYQGEGCRPAGQEGVPHPSYLSLPQVIGQILKKRKKKSSGD